MTPFVTARSEATKSVAASDKANWSAIDALLLELPLVTVGEEILTVGATESYVQLKDAVFVFWLPEASVNRDAGMFTVTVPFEKGFMLAV